MGRPTAPFTTLFRKRLLNSWTDREEWIRTESDTTTNRHEDVETDTVEIPLVQIQSEQKDPGYFFLQHFTLESVVFNDTLYNIQTSTIEYALHVSRLTVK